MVNEIPNADVRKLIDSLSSESPNKNVYKAVHLRWDKKDLAKNIQDTLRAMKEIKRDIRLKAFAAYCIFDEGARNLIKTTNDVNPCKLDKIHVYKDSNNKTFRLPIYAIVPLEAMQYELDDPMVNEEVFVYIAGVRG